MLKSSFKKGWCYNGSMIPLKLDSSGKGMGRVCGRFYVEVIMGKKLPIKKWWFISLSLSKHKTYLIVHL